MNSYSLAERINSKVNASVTYKTDLEQYDTPENWKEAGAFGDCEDYALLKRKMLIDAGFDRDKIHLCTCFVDGAGHCVLLVETDRGNYILDNNQPASEPPMTNQNFGMRFLQDAIMRDNKKQKVFAFYLGESDFIAPEQRGKWKLSVKGTKSFTTDVTKPFGQKVTANDDALVFESKVEAEQWALDNGYIVLQAEQVVKNSILAVQINERKSDVK